MKPMIAIIAAKAARWMMILVALSGAAGCTVTVSPAGQGCGAGTCSVAEHDAREAVASAEFESRIHDYLLQHPEVIGEAQRAMAVRQAAERQAQGRRALAENRDAVFFDPADPVIGNPGGDVTLVEFFDNECPYCRSLAPTIDQLLAEDPGIRIVLKEYPILGPGSEVAARYALAALKQGRGRYAAFHAGLMADKTPEHQLAEARIQQIAKEAGLDLGRLVKEQAAPDITARIAANRALAQKLAINGTPGLVGGDQLRSGIQTIEALRQMVKDARTRRNTD